MVHIGVGNFHRAHQAVFLDDALAVPGNESWGYTGIGLMPFDDKLRDAMKAQGTMYTLWEKGFTSSHVRIMGCHQDFILAPENPEAAVAALSASTTKVATCTLTEKGYFVNFITGDLLKDAPAVKEDIASLTALFPTGSTTLKKKLNTAAAYLVCASKRRMTAGTPGFTVLSCDNVQENGEKAEKAILQMAKAVDPAVADWMHKNVTFPNSMVDRITPATTQELKDQLASEKKIADQCPVCCEDFLLWVVEDKFPYGRPPWEKANPKKCLLVKDVVPYELLKLRLLNAVHQALSYPASLLGHSYVHDSMADKRVAKFLEQYMTAAAKTCKDVQGLDKKEWIKTVIDRFSNPNIKDTILRLTEDATNRIGVALAPCLHADAVNGKSLSKTDLEYIMLPVSCWVRCLLGDSVGPFPEAATLNKDDNMAKVKPPAEKLWAAVSKNDSSAQTAALTFLRAAFTEQAARPETAQILVDQVKTLESKGVEALLASCTAAGGAAGGDTTCCAACTIA
jgi:mannitol 2-dehydrogenase